MKTQAAFTLIEILVAVTILGVVGAAAFTSYGKFAERLAVENAAKELITFIRTAQMKARGGDRGNGNCKATVAAIAQGSSKLNGWKVILSGDKAQMKPRCNDADATTVEATTQPFQQSSIKIYCSAWTPCSSYIYTQAVFGNTWYNATSESGVGGGSEKNQIIVVGDNEAGFFYRFDLCRGSVTNGHSCAKTDCFSTAACNGTY